MSKKAKWKGGVGSRVTGGLPQDGRGKKAKPYHTGRTPKVVTGDA
ncbi:hypothetical protein VTH82DRAFT_275 [Thermothelomyces myriococcoides]